MLRSYPLLFFISSLFFSQIHAQNISVNTTGAANSTSSMFEVLQPSTTNNTVSIFARHNGAATNAYAIWAEATGATNKYALVVPSGGGYVGIGTATPSGGLLHVSSAALTPLYLQTSAGYTYMGALNAGWSHFYTDRPRYYFNTGGTFDTGNIGSYDEDLSLQTSGTTRISVLNTNGNVGLGVTNPIYNLEVGGTFGFGNGSAGSYRSRTETRNNAGLIATQSGFFETSAPSPSTSWPTSTASATPNFDASGNATSWWHLIDSRHSNNGNNYSLQLAGGFFDQRLYFRKTNNNASQAWAEILTTASNGYIYNQTTLQSSANYNISGSGNVQTSFQLQGTNAIFGNANDIYANIRVIQNNSSTLQDGMYINYNSTGGAAAHLKFYANGTTERMRIDASTGNVGINTSSPNMKLEVNSGTGDGITFGQQADNTNTIQTFIDGQWANRATYAGGCCNALAIQPDVGVVGIGTLSPTQKLDVRGNIAQPNDGSLHIFPEVSANTSYHGLMDNNGFFADGIPWYGAVGREPGAWAYPYPDFVMNNHTGVRLAAHGNYGGISFYEELNTPGTVWSSTGNELARFRDDRWGSSYFMTRLGIGTTAPSTNLHVAGNFRLVDGTQGAGKVLTSDASGNASWSNTSTLMQVFTNAASQTNINSTSFIDVIGLSRTITTTVPCYFIINTTGSLESQGTSGTWTGTITALDRGGVSLTEQGNDIINTSGINYVVTHWGINYTEALPAGTYTYKVKCRYYNGSAYFYAGGATTTGLSSDGTMTIQVVPQ